MKDRRLHIPALYWRKLYISNRPYLRRQCARIFVRGYYLFQEVEQFYKSEARGKLWASGNRPCIFLKSNGGYCVYYLSDIFARGIVWKLGNMTWTYPSFSWDSFSQLTRLDQWSTSKKIWCILRTNTEMFFETVFRAPPRAVKESLM